MRRDPLSYWPIFFHNERPQCLVICQAPRYVPLAYFCTRKPNSCVVRYTTSSLMCNVVYWLMYVMDRPCTAGCHMKFECLAVLRSS